MILHSYEFQGKSSYLMPFFCLQVFDFCISCLMVVGYFSYIPDIRSWISQMVRLYPVPAGHTDTFFWLAVLYLVILICNLPTSCTVFNSMQDDLPMKEKLLAMDDDWLMLLAILSFVTALTVKVCH